jgi:LemA protein
MRGVFTIIAIAVVVLWAIVVFNLLVRDRNRVAQGWSDVDVQLLRRHELIPRLVEMVKGYAGYERALLESVATLRAEGAAQGLANASPHSRGVTEKSLGSGVAQLVARVEAYPDLKASANFLELQKQLADTENQIQFARRYYNGAVNLYNNRLQRFPDLLVARTCGFQGAEFFDLDDPGQARAPSVALS